MTKEVTAADRDAAERFNDRYSQTGDFLRTGQIEVLAEAFAAHRAQPDPPRDEELVAAFGRLSACLSGANADAWNTVLAHLQEQRPEPARVVVTAERAEATATEIIDSFEVTTMTPLRKDDQGRDMSNRISAPVGALQKRIADALLLASASRGGESAEDERVCITSVQQGLIDAAVAYVDQLGSFNRLDHPEVQRRRMCLSEMVSAYHNERFFTEMNSEGGSDEDAAQEPPQ